jgi:hypothetical protein
MRPSSNKPVSSLRMVPYTDMNVWFTVYKGSLQWAMLEYRTALKGPNSPVVHVHQGMCSHGCGVRFDVNPHGTTQQMWNALVSFDTRASPPAEGRCPRAQFGLLCTNWRLPGHYRPFADHQAIALTTAVLSAMAICQQLEAARRRTKKSAVILSFWWACKATD